MAVTLAPLTPPGQAERVMRVVIHLKNAVRAFEPTPAQIEVLAARAGRHQLAPVQTDAELLAALPLADAVVAWRFPTEWYAQAPRLRHLFTPSAGREPFAPDPSGRVTRHFGHFHGAIMAESLLGMITFMNRRIGSALLDQADRRWDRTPYSAYRRLHGQVALLIGFGAIGQRCGQLLSALGMIVHGLRRDISRPAPPARRLFSAAQRAEALSLADHIVCALPGDTSTHHFLDAAALSHCRANACIYNIGRGNAIDSDALSRALAEKRLAGAFLDVQPEEPLPPTSPLWTTPNLYLTPHASAISVEYLDLYFEELANELARIE
jgi:D-2-hydroxyacid dehydrogenase (NADP+)